MRRQDTLRPNRRRTLTFCLGMIVSENRFIPSVFDLDLSALSLPGLTRQSIILRRLFFFATDARVRLARDRSEIGAGGITLFRIMRLQVAEKISSAVNTTKSRREQTGIERRTLLAFSAACWSMIRSD